MAKEDFLSYGWKVKDIQKRLPLEIRSSDPSVIPESLVSLVVYTKMSSTYPWNQASRIIKIETNSNIIQWVQKIVCYISY